MCGRATSAWRPSSSGSSGTATCSRRCSRTRARSVPRRESWPASSRSVLGVRRAFALVFVLALVGTAPTAAAVPTLKVVVTAQSHHPVLRHTWWYKVVVTANGKPVACKIHVQVFFNGFSVGEVGTHVVTNGIGKETIPARGTNSFPPAAVGQHVVWHAIATAKGYAKGVGGYPISVVK